MWFVEEPDRMRAPWRRPGGTRGGLAPRGSIGIFGLAEKLDPTGWEWTTCSLYPPMPIPLP